MSDQKISRRKALVNTLLMGGALGVASTSRAQTNETQSDIIVVDSFASLGSTPAEEGQLVKTVGHTLAGVGSRHYRCVTGTVVDDNGMQIRSGTIGKHFKNLRSNAYVSLTEFGGRPETELTQAFIDAATFLLSLDKPGGTIYVDVSGWVMAGKINFWEILATAQGIDESHGYLPNGDLVRGTMIALKGDGYNQSKIGVVGPGDGFVWGAFTNPFSKRAMSFIVDGIDFYGNGAIGHISQTVIPGAQGYSTITNSFAGTTNVATRCLVFEECVPISSVNNCRFRYFQEAIHQTYGFGFVMSNTDIQYCNIGCYIGDGVTTWNIGAGNEIELNAIGVYSRVTSNGRIGASVIEANIAGCDLLVFGSKFLTIDGMWNEGSGHSIVARGETTSPSLPNSGWTIRSMVGLNIDSNGGMVNLHVEDCAINDLGERFEASDGERFENIVYENCTINEGPFDASTITVAGIASKNKIKIKGPTINGSSNDFAMREDLTKKGVTVSTSATLPVEAFTIEVDNVATTGRIEIDGYWKASASAGYRMITFKYVGVIQRAADAATNVSWSTTESIQTSHAATGVNVQALPSIPTIARTGTNGSTQSVAIKFARGTAVSGTAETFWSVKIYNETDNIRFS